MWFAPEPMRARVAFAAAALLVTASVDGCAIVGSPKLDTQRIERAIERSIMGQRGLTSHVTCPKDVPQKTAYVFSCIAKLDVGNTRFIVIENNSKGSARWVGVKP